MTARAVKSHPCLFLLATLLVLSPLSVAKMAAQVPGATRDSAASERFGLSSDAVEVPGKRAARTKRYRIPGTRRFAEVATGRVLHFTDAVGALRSNRPVFVTVGDETVADQGAMTVAASSEGLTVTSKADGGAVTFVTTNRPSVNGKRVGTRIPGQSLQWFWDLDPFELKLISAPIAQREGQATYDFPVVYTDGMTPFALDADGNLESGDLFFGAPVLLGADGESHDGYAAWSLAPSGAVISLMVDDTALPDSALPYRIDPPITQLAAFAGHFQYAPLFDAFDQTWDVPTRALTNNNSKAKAADLDPALSHVTDGLYIYGFGFDLDPQAVVVGVEVTMDRSVQGCGGCNVPADCVEEDQVYLSLDAVSVVGSNQAGLSQPTRDTLRIRQLEPAGREAHPTY